MSAKVPTGTLIFSTNVYESIKAVVINKNKEQYLEAFKKTIVTTIGRRVPPKDIWSKDLLVFPCKPR